MKFPAYFTDDCFTHETEEQIFAKVQALISAMTVEEKAELCHGGINPPNPGQVGNGGYLHGVPRLGVPEIRMYDGPAGVTSIYETTGLPAEELLASTFSRDLAYDFGSVSGSENHMISGNCQLGAEVDLVRTTHFNRTRDMMGEDPFLASELAVPLSRGIQDEHAIATLKHFAGYVVSADPANSPDTVIDEQTLHEFYLKTFEKAIKEGGAAGVMTTYGRINGPYASNAKELLIGVLREEWKFAGLTMSDWGANHSFSLNKGMDIEMPMGAYNSTERIQKFLKSGKLSMDELDAAAGHVLYALGATGYLSLVSMDEDGKVLEEEGRMEPIRIPDVYAESEELRIRNAAIAEKVVEKGAVLLKNDNAALPIQKSDYEGNGQVTLIGLGAKYPVCGYGQERSYGTLKYMTSPIAEMQALAGEASNIVCEIGLDYVGKCIPAEALYVNEQGDEHGLTRYYGISEEDGFRPAPMSMGGEGVEFIGIAERDEKEDDEEGSLNFAPMELFMPSNDAVDMEGYETGSVCKTDPVISFTCGTGVQNYRNYEDGTAFEKGDAYTWKGYLEAPEDGEYQLNLQAIGGAAIFKIDADGSGLSDAGMLKLREGTQWPWDNLVCTPEGMAVCNTVVTLEKGKRYPIMVYAKALLEQKNLQIRLAWLTPSEKKANMQAAIDAASKSKKVVFFVHEGFRIAQGKASGALTFGEGTNICLAEDQKGLMLDVANAVHSNGGKIIVACYNGSAFAMKEWVGQVDAIMYLWMPGQCGSKALAKLLLGKANPGGKTPQSFPNDNEDTLVTDTKEHQRIRWDGETNPGGPVRVSCTEGIFTGYRWYEKENRKPLFPFGFGLSYTTFKYDDFCVAAENGLPVVEFTVENTGNVSGDEIVQLYIGKGEVPEYAMIAEKQLCGFERICDIKPGEKRKVSITIPEECLVYWDIKADYTVHQDGTKDKWKRIKGERALMVGASSSDIKHLTTFKF